MKHTLIALALAQASFILPLEILKRPRLEGALWTVATSGPYQFAGRTVLASGSSTVTVSTTQCNSDSIISYGWQHHTAQNSGFGAGICVRTISPANFFTVGWSDGNPRAFDTVVMWELRRTT